MRRGGPCGTFPEVLGSVLTLVAVLLLLPGGPVLGAPANGPRAPHFPPTPSERALGTSPQAAPHLPNPSLPSAAPPHGPSPAPAALPSYEARVVTSDPSTGSNQGISSTLYLPNATIPAGENWTLLLAQPVTSNEAIGVGIEGSEVGASPGWFGFYELWNVSGPGVTVVRNTTFGYLPGSTVTLGFSWVHGTWWQASINGLDLTGVAGNGTVNVGTATALGISSAAAGFTSPTLLLEGNSTFFPGTLSASVALAVDEAGSLLVPSNGIWEASDPGWQVQGEDQDADLAMGSLRIGSSLPTGLASGSWLWGFGGPGFQSRGNVTSSALGSASGFAFTLNSTLGPGAGTGPNATSFVVALGAQLSTGSWLWVGAWVNAPGVTVLPFYETNRSGVLTFYPGDATRLTHASGLTLEALSYPGGEWSFFAGTAPIIGTQANGTVVAGSPTTLASAPPELSVDEALPTPTVPTPLMLGPAIEMNVSGTWTRPSQGSVGSPPPGCGGCGPVSVEGNAQDLFLGPDDLEWQDGLPALAQGTLLWSGPPGPAAHVSVRGVPSQVGSLARLSAWTDVNGTTGALAGAEVSFLLPSGVSASAPWYLPTGGALVNLTFPLTVSPNQLSLTVEGVAPGWSVGTLTLTPWLVPGNLSVRSRVDAGPLLPGANATLFVWTNATDGAGPLANATLQLRSAAGALLGAVAFDPSTSTYTVPYQAPSVGQPTNDTVSVLASVVGFVPAAGVLSVPLRPKALTLAVHALSAPVPSGGSATFLAWVNASGGGAEGGATLSGTFGLLPLPPSVPTSEVALGEYRFTLSVPLTSQNGSVVVVVEANVTGYAPVYLETSVEVVETPLELRGALSATGSGEYLVSVEVSNSTGPLEGALVQAFSGSGTISPATVSTDPNGSGEFLWAPPAGPGTFRILLTASSAGYYGRNLTLSITLGVGSGPLNVPRTDWLLFSPLAVLAVFLVLFLWGRRRAGPARPRLHPVLPRETEPSQASEKEGEDVATFLPMDSLGLPPPATEVPKSTPPPKVEEEAAPPPTPGRFGRKPRRTSPPASKAPSASASKRSATGPKKEGTAAEENDEGGPEPPAGDPAPEEPDPDGA